MNIAVVKELFAGFLRTRRLGRHFRRLTILESFRAAAVVREMPPSLAERLLAASRSGLDALWAELQSHPDGLTDDQADAVRARVGPNEVEHEKPLPWWVHLWHCYQDSLQSVAHRCWPLVSYLDRRPQGDHRHLEHDRAGDADPLLAGGQVQPGGGSSLKAMVSNTATVRRRDLAAVVAGEVRALFPGDAASEGTTLRSNCRSRGWCRAMWSCSCAGDMIPGRLPPCGGPGSLRQSGGDDGESLPVEKFRAAAG